MSASTDAKVQVKDATDIVRLIGEHIRLTPKGREFVCLCPFHNDKNPSMYVIPQKQIYHCFVCGASGDAFTFMMNYHRMDFPEALKSLAERAGIVLPEREPHRAFRSGGEAGGSGETNVSKDELRQANELAQQFFSRHLGDMLKTDNPALHPPGTLEARDYLRQRYIKPDMVEAFQIGYAPDSWDQLAQRIHEKRLNINHFEVAGLVAKRKQGQGHYDKLRHRLIFPIHDRLGRTIGFGARKLRKEDEPKYLNSPETPLFHKSNTLYGMHQASRAIIETKTAIVVEGYTDVIACHQAGFTHTIAALGTAFTAQHARLLQQKAEKIILLFDADEAGMKAADRAVEVFFKQSMDVHVAVLPPGKDPADMLTGETEEACEKGKMTFQSFLDQAQDAMSFLFDRLKKDLSAIPTMSGQEHRAESFLQKLTDLGVTQTSPVRKAMIVTKLAGIMQLPESAIQASLKRNRTRATPRLSGNTTIPAPPDFAEAPVQIDDEQSPFLPDSASASPATSASKRSEIAEKELLGCLMNDPRLIALKLNDEAMLHQIIDTEDFLNPRLGDLYGELLDSYLTLNHGENASKALVGQLQEDARFQEASELLALQAGINQRMQQADPAAMHQNLEKLARDATQLMRQEKARADYNISKEELLDEEASLLRIVQEHNRSHQSPSKFPRPRI